MHATRARRVPVAVMMSCLALPVLAGCSSGSAPFGSSSQTAATAPPARSGVLEPTAGLASDDPRYNIYPSVSLSTIFSGSSSQQTSTPQPPSSYTASAQPNSPSSRQGAASGPAPSSNMPHPPSSYTASAPPYNPAGAQTAAAAAPPPPDPQPEPASVPGYPSQTLFDLFKNK